jgi:flagellar biosynthetic protein FlhB
MLAAVAGADVIVVNPTHYAVALAYQPSRGAPRVVAKGVDKVAARIREEAERHGVPMVVDAPLARTLHRACELGDEVPAALYEAVARVLAFVYALRSRGPAVSNTHRLPLPAAV